MEIIRHGLDTDLYPNVDWHDELLKKSTTNYRSMLNISGGGSLAKYYISGAYYNEEGMYKNTSLTNYDTNANYERYNFRSNVDMALTNSTDLEFGVSGWIVNQNKPGSSSDEIWGSLSRLTSLTVHIKYSNVLFPTYGTGNVTNPYVLLNETGYKTLWENKMETNISLKQDLSFLVDGLRVGGRFSYDSYNFHQIDRLKYPDLYRAENQRDGRGNLILRKVADSSPLEQSTSAWGDRRYYSELTLNYEQMFADLHRVTGMLLYYRQETTVNDAGNDVFAAVPKRNMAFSGRATYDYDSRYFLEANVGYTGSENFEKGRRFGIFPAFSGGWMVTNEPFLEERADWLSSLKFRYSYGEVGNDILPDDKRFPYISTVTGMGDYQFGNNAQVNVGGIGIGTIGTPHLTWEIARKHNVGVDLELFDAFNLTVDAFQDNRERIFMQRGHIPATTGLQGDGQVPWANVGKMESRGMDGVASYTNKIGNVNYTFRGNFTYSYSEVIDFDEAVNEQPYQMTQGYRWGQTRGLIARGFFEDFADIENSPEQTFTSDVLPGDIKYKDVNGDGQITDDDVVPIGYSTIPGLIYGMGLSLQYSSFDFNILMQGAGNSDFFLGGSGVYPFVDGDFGNILTQVAQKEDRWISREISGDPSTERADAIFPRLSFGGNANNYRGSSFWLRNARYLRLKNLEIGYRIPKVLGRRFNINDMRLYFIGTNLMVFDDFGWWDPEIGSSDGAVYPLQATYTLGMTINF
jgi:TonB-linked SusC/RagA family outer membrane protein